MKVIIMAAGRGERLFSRTQKVPKPLLKIRGKPVLEYIIVALKKQGLKDFIFNLHYLPRQFQKYFSDGRKWGIKIEYFVSDRLLERAEAIKKLEDRFKKTFMVVNADTLLHFQLADAISFHNKKAALATLVLKKSRFPQDGDVWEVDKKGRVVKAHIRGKRGGWVGNLTTAGIFIFSPDIFKLIPDAKSIDLEQEVLVNLVQKRENIYGFVAKGEFLDVGTPERFGIAKREIDRFI